MNRAIPDEALEGTLVKDDEMLEDLLNISRESIAALFGKIVGSTYAKDRADFVRLYRMFLLAAELRYMKTQELVDLTGLLYADASKENTFGLFRDCSLRALTEVRPSLWFPWLRYVYFCLTQFLCTSEAIVQTIGDFRTMNPGCREQFAIISAWFLPQLKRIRPDLYEEAMTIGKKLRNSCGVSLVYRQENLDLETLDDWIYFGFEPDSVGVALVTDDVEFLKTLVIEKNLDINGLMPQPAYLPYLDQPPESYPFDSLDKTTLLQGAMFFGSTTVFKFLLMNGADSFDGGNRNTDMDYQYVSAAICAGSLAFLRFCAEEKMNVMTGIVQSVFFHQHDIYEWLKSGAPNIDSELDTDLMIAAAISKNFSYLVDIPSFSNDVVRECCRVDDLLLLRWFTISFDLRTFTDRTWASCVETSALQNSWNCLDWLLTNKPSCLAQCRYGHLLEQSVASGCLFVVSALWNAGLQPSSPADLLLTVCEHGHARVLEFLFVTGFGDNCEDYQLSAALRAAVEFGHAETVKVFLQWSGVKESLLNGQQSPLLPAIRMRDVKVLDVILADPRVVVSNDALLLASQLGFSAGVAKIIARGGVDINCQENGVNPLSKAIASGNLECVKALLDCGRIDVNAKVTKHQSALHIAVIYGVVEIVDLLVHYPGILCDEPDDKGMTPLHYAAQLGHEDIACLLLENGTVNVNSKNSEKETPLFFAINGPHPKLVRMLLQCSQIDVNCANAMGRTPLHAACIAGDYDIALLMIRRTNELGVNFLAVDQFKWTCLHHAARWGFDGIVLLLLPICPELINKQTHDGYTALHLACMYKNIDCVRAIMEQSTTQPNLRTAVGVSFVFIRHLSTLLPLMDSLMLFSYFLRILALIRQSLPFVFYLCQS